MKKTITSLMLVASTMLTLNAQVMIQEDFNSPFNAATAGWVRINNSPAPNTLWSQGNGTIFPAFNGGPNDFYSVNFASTALNTATTISNWLISPTVTVQNGAVLQFATRTSTNPAAFPDRLEVYLSEAGNGTNVGTTPTSLGTFSTLLVTVNPNLTTVGYPGQWTVYTATLSGIVTPTVGRIGFRYHVINGGPASNAVNSNYIGLDAVRYTVPCNVLVPSFTVCAGGAATLQAINGTPNTTYSWSPTAGNNSSLVVTPGATTTYTLDYDENGNPCPSVTSTVTIGGQLSVLVTASSSTVCAGGTVTLTANSAASTYSWSNGATAPSITVAPTSNTTYSVGALAGNFPAICLGGNTIAITAVARPTVVATSASTLLCTTGASTSVTFTGTGASSYIWVLGSSQASGATISVQFAAPTPTATTNQTLGLIGIDGATGCFSTDIFTLTISPQPTLSITSSTNVACTNKSVTLTGTGADNYSWAGPATSTNSALIFTTTATAGSMQFTLTGTSTAGCSQTSVYSQSVVVCNTNTGTTVGIGENQTYVATAIFPNPFTNEIKIANLDGTVVVYNTTGQLVISEKIQRNGSVNTSDLPKGAYIVKTYNVSGELVKSAKLMKN